MVYTIRSLDIPPDLGYDRGMCNKCKMAREDIEFWDTHQTMQDGNIWCVNKS